MDKHDAPTIAQSGLMLQLWDLLLWCEKWQIPASDQRDLLRWFGEFHKKEMARDLERHIARIGNEQQKEVEHV